jgi:hypothetical protein
MIQPSAITRPKKFQVGHDRYTVTFGRFDEASSSLTSWSGPRSAHLAILCLTPLHRRGGCSTLLAAIAEFERDLIRERTGDGRKRAMTNGVKFCRKPKLSEYQRDEAIKRREAGETLAEIAKSYAVDVSMISRL